VQPGQRIGKYVLGERIAVGGMAEVWAARAEGPQGFVKPVALKFILESFAGDPELEQLFIKEARIAAQLQHANLVAVFDFDKVAADQPRGQGGRYYIAMEQVEGYDARRVAQAARHAGYVFPLPLALYLAGEVLKGLRYVHEKRDNGRPLGLVHRDVSPHNVLVGFSGEVKLSDFGIAKSLAHSHRTKNHTKTGTIRGKLSYASPEQLNGEAVDHRTDQFAMGITLWEILAGRPLFDGSDELEIAGKVMRCEIPPLALVNPDRSFPAVVEAVVRRMLSLRRDDRYHSTTGALSAVLSLPGYTGDGFGLGDLVRTLFHRAAGEFSSTLPIEDPAAQAQLRDKRDSRHEGNQQGRHARNERPGTDEKAHGKAHGKADGKPDGKPAPPPSLVATRTMPRAGGAVARPGKPRVDEDRPGTLPTEPLAAARPRHRWVPVTIAVAVAAAGAIAAGAAVLRSSEVAETAAVGEGARQAAAEDDRLAPDGVPSTRHAAVAPATPSPPPAADPSGKILEPVGPARAAISAGTTPSPLGAFTADPRAAATSIVGAPPPAEAPSTTMTTPASPAASGPPGTAANGAPIVE
jgi:serine/threonine protein kinase